MATKQVLADVTDMAKFSVCCVDRSKLLHEIGVLEGLSWAAPEPFGDAINCVVEKLLELIGGELP